MKLTYSTLRKSYQASRALALKNQEIIYRLIVKYRLQSAGRAMPQVERVAALRAWIERESRWGLSQRLLRSFDAPKFLMARNDELIGVAFTQADLMQLLARLTKANGNGFSPTQAYAQMEHGKTAASFGRFRDAAKLAEEARQRAETEKVLAQRETYRTWKPEESILGRNRGGTSIHRN